MTAARKAHQFTTSVRVDKDSWMALRLRSFLRGAPLADELDEAIRRYVGPELLAEAEKLRKIIEHPLANDNTTTTG